MRFLPAAPFCLLAVSLFAQPAAPDAAQLAALVADARAGTNPRTAAATVPLTVNTASREEVRQFYRAIYPLSENVPMGWTGSYTAATSVAAAGDTSPAFKDAVALRLNFFRALAGVPAGITLNSTYNAKNQQAALMMSANNTLQHDTASDRIPTSWTYYTAAGAEASTSSNLTLGIAGAAAIDSLMQDSDGSGNIILGANARVGHRRWILYPQTLEMGTGDVPGNGTTLVAAHTSWIVDSKFGQARPSTRNIYVAYPPPGYVPYKLVWPRWSFAYPGANFANASVAMNRNGAPVPVRLETYGAGSGENTLVWVYDNLSTVESLGHVRPTADTTYTVTVSNATATVSGATVILAPVTYSVTVFDPDVLGADAVLPAIAGSSTPATAQASSYTVAKGSFTSGFEWRAVALGTFAKTYNAESGLDGLLATVTTGAPATVQTALAGRGTSAYRLAHVPRPGNLGPETQFLTLPDTLLVGSGAALNFLSFLNVAAPAQVARVQASTDNGVTWIDLYAQAGTSPTNTSTPGPTDTGFTARSVSLADFTGRTLRLRFAFTIAPGPAFPGAENNPVGWFLDDLALTNVQTAAPGTTVAVATGSTFAFTPAASGPIGLQARGLLFGTYPAEWGTVLPVTALPPGAAANPGRLINLSVLTEVASAGDSFTLGYVVGGSTSGVSKPLVIRAAGPSLGALGVPGTLDDPKLELYAAAAKNGENDNWGGSATLTAALNAVGAFPYSGPASRDSAVAANITTRDNSVVVSAVGSATGTVIAEIYDATPAGTFTTTTPRLLNVSVNKHLGSGLTAGFVVGGATPLRVLIRAVGPGLAAFGVPGTVVDPQLALFNASSVKIAENNDWSGTAALTAAFASVGAFALPSATSKDAALVLTLQPGNYSVQVSGVANTTGVALVEVYQAPEISGL